MSQQRPVDPGRSSSPWPSLRAPVPPQLQFARSLIEDIPNEPGDDSVHQSADLMDILPPEQVLAGLKGLAAVKGMAALKGAPMVAGAIKMKPGVRFDRFKQLMAGANPLDMGVMEYGKHVQSLGPDMRVKGAELLGAQ